jgi:hypothetical protein
MRSIYGTFVTHHSFPVHREILLGTNFSSEFNKISRNLIWFGTMRLAASCAIPLSRVSNFLMSGRYSFHFTLVSHIIPCPLFLKIVVFAFVFCCFCFCFCFFVLFCFVLFLFLFLFLFCFVLFVCCLFLFCYLTSIPYHSTHHF